MIHDQHENQEYRLKERVMKSYSTTVRVLAVILATVLFVSDPCISYVYAAEDDMLVISDEEDAACSDAKTLEETEMIEEIDAQDELVFASAKKILWQTGVAAVSEFVPGGKKLKTLLNACGSLMDSGPAYHDVSEQIDKTSSDISGLSKELSEFRNIMNARLDGIESGVAEEIKDTLDTIKNDIFISGVGSELDTLHSQVNEKNGIGKTINTINNDAGLSKEAKAIEIAYLIGNDKDWDETNNALYRFNNVGDLVAGHTYRDTRGRNLYEVLYDNAAQKYMFTGEVYDDMDPYIDRVVEEYFYAYTVLVQCLNAHLIVSRMTDEQAKALGDFEYNRYLECKTPTSLVKMEIDDITAELLDPEDPKSVISLYATFKYKKKHARMVFINKGKTSIALSNELDEIRVPYIGSRQINPNDPGGYVDDYQYFNFYQDRCYNKYFERWDNFANDSSHLDPAYVKIINDYVHDNSTGRSLFDYLGEMGIFVANHKTDNPFFLADKSHKRTFSFANDTDGKKYHAYYSFSSIDPKSTEKVIKDTTFHRLRGLDYSVKVRKQKKKKWYTAYDHHLHVYVIYYDVSYLALKKANNDNIPSTAKDIPLSSEYTWELGRIDFTRYLRYDLNDIPIKFHDENGNPVTINDFKWIIDNESQQNGAHFYDGHYVIFTGDGPCRIGVNALDPDGKVIDGYVPINILPENSTTYMDLSYFDKPYNKFYVNQKYNARTDLFDQIYVLAPEDRRLPESQVIFESKELPEDGIELDPEGPVEFTKPGTFHLRCVIEDQEGGYAERDRWFSFTVKDAANTSVMTFVDSNGTALHHIAKPEGETIGEDDLPNGVELYWRNNTDEVTSMEEEDSMEEENSTDEEDLPTERDGYTFIGWDRLDDTNGEDGLPDEIPKTMPGEDTVYRAIWERTVKTGYKTVTDEESLIMALSETPASGTTKLALANDITVRSLVFPKTGDMSFEIDGMSNTMTFSGNADISLKNKQSLVLEDIVIKAENKGKVQNIKFTTQTGGMVLNDVELNGGQVTLNSMKGSLSLDDVEFDCKKPVVNAKGDRLDLEDVIANDLTVKGSTKTVLATDGTVRVSEIIGFKKIDNSGTLTTTKTLKVNYLDMSGNAVLDVPGGSLVTISRGITGNGTIILNKGFLPITLGKENSGSILLTSDETMEYREIFKTKASELDSVFDVRQISPEVSGKKYKYGLYCRAGKACLRAYTIAFDGRKYCEWKDVVADIAKKKPAGDVQVTLLADVDIAGSFKLPAKGTYTSLTINGDGYNLNITDSSMKLTGNLKLKNITVNSESRAWTIKKGKYSLATDGAKLIGCRIE